MMTRRHFLLGASSSLIGWMVEPAIARQIIHAAEEYGEMLTVPLVKPKHFLWFNESEEIFSLDTPRSCMTMPELTWRDWFNVRGVKPHRQEQAKEAIREYGFQHLLTDSEDEEAPFPMPDLDAVVPDEVWMHYIEWDYSIYDSPEARALDYLECLDLGEGLRCRGEGLGKISFVHGANPGSNFCYATASGIEALSGLQQRLIQLGEEVEVRID